MEFQDELAAGVTLVRPALQSPDYAAGSAGWAIKIDGSAEFNNITIRGAQTIGGEALYYDGTPAAGSLILSISAAGGTDDFGNAFVGGLGIYDTDGSQIQLQSGAGASQYFTPQDVVGTVWGPALITTTLGASSRGGLSISSPNDDVNTRRAAIDLYGGGPTTTDTSVLIGADRVNLSGTLEVTDEITTYNNNTFTSYTPSLTNTGGATYTTQTGWWVRLGKMIIVGGYIVINAAGAGAGIVGLTAPTNIDRTGRQAIAMNGDNITGFSGAITAVALSGAEGASGSTFERVRSSTGTNLTGAAVIAGSRITFVAMYREA